MHTFEKLYTLFITFSALFGLLLGRYDFIRENANDIIVPALVMMLFITFLQISFKETIHAMKNTKFTVTSLGINFIWTPLLAGLLAYIFLYDHPALWIGFILLMVTPCTDWYLIFTSIARGNVPLSTAVLPINFIVQVLLLPIFLIIFAGTTGFIQMTTIVQSILFVLCLPLLMAYIVKRLTRKRQVLYDNINAKLSSLPVVFLCIAIMAMFASEGYLLFQNLELLAVLLIPVTLFFIINFYMSQLIGKKLNFNRADRVSLVLTTLARNSPIALALAIVAFPAEPLIPLTLIIGPLLELPILMLATQLLLKNGK
ncbi:arsenic resistance protein [Evansella cellulosilytica]|uniref:Bile acid:sodium symporter n=1 Tax=Evansella cellulosilytica (strain ATCC 21833 / DSM 2522 / FERM P-1141 / JCM 9156 / N-4) TaxID=649639 RepID=E6TUY0_EVAC2|nr:bile acid:sodium symporter [Evansella cellulosilytica]ADU28563.1 Bile acid:sodium symporter [Evansella cellulosilytica DSM 2522]